MWQAYLLDDPELKVRYTHIGRSIPIFVPASYTGNWETWHENGQLCEEALYENGNLVGVQKRFNRNGKLIYRKYFENNDYYEFYLYRYFERNQKNGHAHGVQRMFHDSGKKMAEYYYFDGKQHGKEVRYNEMGILRYEAVYKNGLLSGIVKTYYDSGNIRNVSQYAKGRCVGLFINYFEETGDLEEIQIWNDKKDKVDNSKIIYSKVENVDLRSQYAKEIAEFEAELAKFEKEHGLK